MNKGGSEVSGLNEEAFHQFFRKVISPALRQEEESIQKINQLHTEEEQSVSEDGK